MNSHKWNWNVAKTIREFRNIRNIDFKFVKGGINIIVGKNNVGKTNILDFLYEENKKWDDFEANEEEYRKEELPQGLIPRHRDSTYLLELFFPRRAFLIYPNDLGRSFSPFKFLDCWITASISPYLIHASHPEFKEKPKERKMTLSYRIYYFDLTASTSFLNKEGKKDLRLNKVKFRSCEFYYGRFEEGLNLAREYFIIESERKPKEEIQPWTPRFDNRNNFIKHQDEEKIIYYGLNRDVSHPLDKLGSGYLKIETLKSLIEDLKNEQQIQEGKYLNKEEKWKRSAYPKLVHAPILLMDEPEVFLHSSFTSGLANTIKGAGKKNITTILTTHSPTFLSHFVSDLFTINEINLTIIQKGSNGRLRNPVYFCDWAKEKNNKEEIISKWMSYCQCFRKELEKGNTEIDKLYYNQWRSILNKHTLRVFFSKEIIFVEGPSDYILLTNEIVEKKLDELESKGKIKLELKDERKQTMSEKFKEIEIIPIFGKSNYIFFRKLAESLHLKYWFLLDMDKQHIDEKQFPKDSSQQEEKKNISPKNCSHEELLTRFWYHHKGELKNPEQLEEDKITHSTESKISWFPKNIEKFLLEESAQKWAKVLGNEWTEPMVEEWKKQKGFNFIAKVESFINSVKTDETFLREIKEKYNCETFSELISKKEPEKVINIIKKFREKHNGKAGDCEHLKNHQWINKESRMVNNIVFSNFDQERLNELGIALGEIVNRIAQKNEDEK